MAELNFREHVLGQLKPLLPKAWKLSPVALQDIPQQVSVELLLQRIERLNEAPQGIRLVTYTLNVVTPGVTDDPIDDAVIDLLNAIDSVAGLSWSGAERGVWGLDPSSPSNPCYTISLTYPFEKVTN